VGTKSAASSLIHRKRNMMNREDKDSENKGQEEEDEEGEQKNRIRYANWTTHFLSLCI
jgi:hypothetical protein